MRNNFYVLTRLWIDVIFVHFWNFHFPFPFEKEIYSNLMYFSIHACWVIHALTIMYIYWMLGPKNCPFHIVNYFNYKSYAFEHVCAANWYSTFIRNSVSESLALLFVMCRILILALVQLVTTRAVCLCVRARVASRSPKWKWNNRIGMYKWACIQGNVH